MSVQEAFWDYFRLAKFFLQVAGICPIGGTPSLWKSVFNVFIPAFPLLYVLIPQINYILFQTHTAVDDLLDAVVLAISILAVYFRLIVVSVNRRKIKRLFAACETLWDHAVLADYNVTLVWAKRARLFSSAYFYVAQLSIVAFPLNGIAKQLSKPENSTIRYYAFHYPEDSTPSPQYEIKYVVQVIICSVTMIFVVAADMTSTLLALNMCGQFALIRSWLVDISREDSSATEENIKRRAMMLNKCIRRHQFVLELCAELEEVVHYINLIQMMLGIYVVAICGARLTQGLMSTRYLGSLVFTLSGLYFTCWPAESLSVVSSEVAAAVYGVPWYNYSYRSRMTVAFMLMRSQRPVKLTAGKFVALSLETFSSIVSASASYFMVLYRFS